MNYLHRHKPRPIIHRDLTPRYIVKEIILAVCKSKYMTIYRSKLYHSFPPWTANVSSSLFCRNVLQDEAGRLKVTDFGLSKIAQQNDLSGYKMTGRTGSCKIFLFDSKIKYSLILWCLTAMILLLSYLLDRYMAPEVYRRESYGKSIDIFSFALIVHEVHIL